MATTEALIPVADWAGRRVARLVRQTIHEKGDVCVLCGYTGADSADHNPPRSVLLRAGVPDPDALEFLFPAHRYPCNITRQARPITPELRAELRARFEAHIARVSHRADLSPRFASRGPSSLTIAPSEAPRPPSIYRTDSSKNGRNAGKDNE